MYDDSSEIFIMDIYKETYGSKMCGECLGRVCGDDICQGEDISRWNVCRSSRARGVGQWRF